MNVIIVDDQADNLRAMKRIAEGCGYTVSCAANGQFARKLAESVPFHIAVLDISIPQLNGLDLAEKLRVELPQVKVVILTMHKSGEFVSKALCAGVRGYVLKENALEELIECILLVISQKKVRRRRIEILSRCAVSVFDGIGQQTEFIQAKPLLRGQNRIRKRLVPRLQYIRSKLERFVIQDANVKGPDLLLKQVVETDREHVLKSLAQIEHDVEMR